jgi:hypothetical protein
MKPVSAIGAPPKKKTGCLTYLKRLDNEVIKPLLIYKYEQTAHKKQREFFDMMMKEGHKIEEAYAGKTERKSGLLDVVSNKSGNRPGSQTEKLD